MPVRERLDTVQRQYDRTFTKFKEKSVPRPLFFDLPPELRDQIYDLLATTKYSIPLKLHERPFAYIDIPHPHARLISRRFKTEVEARITKSATLCLKDRSEGDGCGPPTQLGTPGWRWCLGFVTHVEMEIHLGCSGCSWECPVARGVSNDVNWLIPFAASLRKLEMFDVEIYLWWEAGCEEALHAALSANPRPSVFGLALRRLVDEVPQIRSLKVHRHFAGPIYSGDGSGSCKDLAKVIWDDENGWQVSDVGSGCNLGDRLQ